MLLLSDCTDASCMRYLVQQEAKHVSRIARESRRFALKCQGTEPMKIHWTILPLYIFNVGSFGRQSMFNFTSRSCVLFVTSRMLKFNVFKLCQNCLFLIPLVQDSTNGGYSFFVL